jgi:desumoylating isopeptidase 1
MLLGKHIEGIWHTSLIVYGKEYYFGKGICYNLVGNTPFGKPTRVVDLGETRKSEERFYEGLDQLLRQFNIESYHVINNNCNHFSEACT